MNIEQLIEEREKTLPPNLLKAINSFPWKALVQNISKENLLNPEQGLALEQETMFILYEFESPTDFIKNIVENVKVSEEVASTIANSAAEKVFEPILKASNEGEAGEKTSETVPSSPPPTTDEQKTQPSSDIGVPNYSYESGKDPYREPLEDQTKA